MATFLELCKDVARESGTVQPSAITSVANQTGRIQKIVQWTAEAWRRIQNANANWLFLRETWSAETISGTKLYTPASLNITDLARWMTDRDAVGYKPTSLYKTSVGQSDENAITHITYGLWRARYDRGAQSQNRPAVYAITPYNEIAFGPTPDDAYTIRGEYYRTPQVLTANDDEPLGLPVRFHPIIVYRALVLLGEHDEGQVQIASAERNYRELLGALERDQLPPVTIECGPVA
jgi:hypothetical protein